MKLVGYQLSFLKMVNGPRRARRLYSVNLRHHGKTLKNIVQSKKMVLLIDVMVARVADDFDDDMNNLLLLVILLYQKINGVVRVDSIRFAPQHITAEALGPEALYALRITSIANFYRLYHGMQFPDFIRCDNGTCCLSEKAFLMLLWFLAYPTRQIDMQKKFGLEYSQISRVIKFTVIHIDTLFSHLITNSIGLFVHRLLTYNQCFIEKYVDINDINEMHRYWQHIALFTDGMKRFTTRNFQGNYSGHKKQYCLSYLYTTAPDGMIVEVGGPHGGHKNDHTLQNDCTVGFRLVAAQVNNGLPGIYETGTDKGFHQTVGLRPMHHRIIPLPTDRYLNLCFSRMRASNEHDLGRVGFQWKHMEFKKGLQLRLQPLAKFERVCALLTNFLNCLDHSQTSKFYNCPPPSFEEYIRW